MTIMTIVTVALIVDCTRVPSSDPLKKTFNGQACLRVIHPKNDPSNKTLLAAVPLAVIDASICW